MKSLKENQVKYEGQETDFDMDEFFNLIKPDSDSSDVSSFLSLVCRNDFNRITDDSKKGIVKLVINNAGRLPIAREIYQAVQD